MGKLLLNELEIYAYHGVHEVEQKVGQWYLLNIELEGDFSIAIQTDELSGTIDYEKVVQLVQQEMAIPSKLIEHVAGRIAKGLKKEFPQIKTGKIFLTKKNPPVKLLAEVCIQLSIN